MPRSSTMDAAATEPPGVVALTDPSVEGCADFDMAGQGAAEEGTATATSRVSRCARARGGPTSPATVVYFEREPRPLGVRVACPGHPQATAVSVASDAMRRRPRWSLDDDSCSCGVGDDYSCSSAATDDNNMTEASRPKVPRSILAAGPRTAPRGHPVRRRCAS